MKYAHLIKLTAFSYEHENSQSVVKAFLGFFPFDFGKNGIILSKRTAYGFNERRIGIFEATLAKTNPISQFLRNLLVNLDKSQRQQILSQAESRLDKNLDFCLRFDKDSWIQEKKLVLTASGKCFHLKISIAAFPKKREVALNVIRDLFVKGKA